MQTYLDFEKPVAEIEGKIRELRQLASEGPPVNVEDEIVKLEARARGILKQTYERLTPWQKTQVARHPKRPHFCDYVDALFTDYIQLAGDRGFANDPALLGGLARFHDRAVMVLGHEKGTDTESRVRHNFGMARPEGYRKAIRLMRLAERFGLPVITLVDTPGAYPGIGAEERGQAEAIARAIECCLALTVPMIAVIVGEGGSGGAVAVATGNQVLMLEHAVYSVISPEGCASILWRNSDRARDAAAALKLTAQDLHELGVIDRIVEEPVGGAHRDPASVMAAIDHALTESFLALAGLPGEALRQQRRHKFLQTGRQDLS
jgi:acetyl-CoA carboxylase carboxyl transferase subunit alpha